MRIAVEGCAHGDLDRIYDVINSIEEREQKKVDLLICCGDFQSNRNISDLICMAVPMKYLDICSFYKYYSGEKVAPIPTIFIGGNHEASNYLQELSYGGWVAPNIYYLGYAGVINVNGIRIGGISGIFKGYDYRKGHYEFPPYNNDSRKSVYHTRSVEVFRLMQLTPKIDIMISHDWPTNITSFGNLEQLLRFKPYFKQDIDNNRLGSPPCEDLLHTLKPKHWFSAHLHCRFTAQVQHSEEQKTDFLALDKCLPKRRFLEIITIDSENDDKDDKEIEFYYDLEWLTILSITNKFLNVKSYYTRLPQEQQGNNGDERTDFRPTQEEMDAVLKKFNGDLKIPKNFCRTVPAFNPQTDSLRGCNNLEVQAEINPQTTEFCEKLGIDDPMFVALSFAGRDMSQMSLNTSHIEAEANTTQDDSTLDISTTEAELSFSKRAPLASFLPKPKFSEEIELGSDSDTESAAKEPEPVEIVEDKSTTEEACKRTIEAVEITSDKVSEIAVETPGKKFKRRNQSIYATEDN